MMASQQVCTFFVDHVYFGIEIQSVQEIIRHQVMTRIPLAPKDICGLINLRGQIVTVVDLQRRLTIPSNTVTSDRVSVSSPSSPVPLPSREQRATGHEQERQFYNIVVRNQNEIVSLMVDELGDILEFPEEEFEPPPATLRGRMRQFLRGAYQLPDGFLLVLDPEKVLHAKSSS